MLLNFEDSLTIYFYSCVDRHELVLGNTFNAMPGAKSPDKEVPPEVKQIVTPSFGYFVICKTYFWFIPGMSPTNYLVI